MAFMSIAKALAFAFFVDSGGLSDRRVALRAAREAAFRSSGRPTAGFRWLRWRAQVHQKRRNGAMDSHGRQASRIVATLPRQP